MELLVDSSVEQESFAAAANRIVREGKDYTAFRRYMRMACPDVEVCDSCMCPNDSRLNDKENQDAIFCCALALSNRERESVCTVYLCSCGQPRKKRHRYCEACKVSKIRSRDRLKKEKKRCAVSG